MTVFLIVTHETPADDVEAQTKFVQGEYLPTDYIRVGKFVNGLADGPVPSTIGKVSEILIRVNDHTGENWVIISEVCTCFKLRLHTAIYQVDFACVMLLIASALHDLRIGRKISGKPQIFLTIQHFLLNF